MRSSGLGWFKSEIFEGGAASLQSPQIDREQAGTGDDRLESPASPYGLRYGLRVAPRAVARWPNTCGNFLNPR